MRQTFSFSLFLSYILLASGGRREGAFEVQKDSCSSSIYSKERLVRNLKGEELLFIGDSVVRNSFLALVRMLDEKVQFSHFSSKVLGHVSKQTKNLKETKVPGRNIGIWSYRSKMINMVYYYTRTTEDSKLLLSTYVGDKKIHKFSGIIYSNSLWDIGRRFNGHAEYYHGLAEVLNLLQKRLKYVESKVILLGFQFIEINDCPKVNSICTVCNHNIVQDFVREAQQRVVSCTQQSLYFDTLTITNSTAAKSLSSDGIHPGLPVARASALLAVQALYRENSDCSLFHKRNACDKTLPKISSRKILEAREDVDNILAQARLKSRKFVAPRCFTDHVHSLFWNVTFNMQD